MKYAIIALAGRQFMVKEGDSLEVTHQNELTNQVLFYKNDATVLVGTPFLEDITVELERLEDKKDKKVVVARFRAKSRHRVRKGHRQPISILKVKSVGEIKQVKKKAAKKEETV